MANDPNPAVPRPDRAVLGDRVFRVLGAAIRDGRLEPGQPVRDVELARELGVSRTPVREALQRLERIGLVEIAANRYTRITEVTDRARTDTREYIVYTMATALRLAITHATDDELAHALALFDAMVAASDADDHAELVVTSTRFYRTLTMITHNVVFIRVLAEASLTFDRNLEGWTPFIPAPEQRATMYRDLRQAIEARDAVEAERVFRAQHGIA